MFKKSFIIVFFVLLLAIFCNKTLQAMYIPNLWEEIWEEDEAIRREEQCSRFNTLLDADHDFIPEGLVEKIIGMDGDYHLLSKEEKRESVHTLRAFLHETTGLRLDAVKRILRSLCNKCSSEFKYLNSEKKDSYSTSDLQALFEKSIGYKSRLQLIIQKVPRIIGKITPKIICMGIGTFWGFFQAEYWLAAFLNKSPLGLLLPFLCITLVPVIFLYRYLNNLPDLLICSYLIGVLYSMNCNSDCLHYMRIKHDCVIVNALYNKLFEQQNQMPQAELVSYLNEIMQNFASLEKRNELFEVLRQIPMICVSQELLEFLQEIIPDVCRVCI